MALSTNLVETLYDHAQFPRKHFKIGPTDADFEALHLPSCSLATGHRRDRSRELWLVDCDCVRYCRPGTPQAPLAAALLAANPLDRLAPTMQDALSSLLELRDVTDIRRWREQHATRAERVSHDLRSWAGRSPLELYMASVRKGTDAGTVPEWAAQLVEDRHRRLVDMFREGCANTPWADVWKRVDPKAPDGEVLLVMARPTVALMPTNNAKENLAKVMVAATPTFMEVGDKVALLAPAASVPHFRGGGVQAVPRQYAERPDVLRIALSSLPGSLATPALVERLEAAQAAIG